MPLLAWCDNITFSDAEVKAICVKNWDTNGDGELSKTEAAAVKNLGTHFKDNASIKSFDELQYFIGLTSIKSIAFYGCSGLTDITIPNSVTSIGLRAFSRCSGLTNITIPNSVTSIDSEVFSFCTSLISITLQGPISFGSKVFYESNNLKEVHIPDLEVWMGSSFKYDQSNPLSLGAHLYLNGTELTSITIPNTVNIINEYAFYGYKDLKSITIPNSVTSISSSAFSGCSGLTDITIPNSVTSIDSYAFYGCSGLTDITIPNSVTSLGAGAFYGCKSLTSITLLSSIYFDRGVFEECNNLKEVHITNIETWLGCSFKVKELSDLMPNESNPLALGACLYLNGTELTSITIPNTINKINEYVFRGYKDLKSITIPNSVTSIGEYNQEIKGETNVEIIPVIA